jgi:hypothetical protein
VCKEAKVFFSALLGVVAKQKRTARYQITLSLVFNPIGMLPVDFIRQAYPHKQGALAWFESIWPWLGRPRMDEQ